ncbi:MAG TPA: hypothetical protein VHX65_03070 [Pirellulales bacterium]|jgi:hypothetical protein|nr:hypothetical protein [Pirellulales bacterium]
MLNFASNLQSDYERSVSAPCRKERGQVFTPPEVARFMAGLLDSIPTEYVLLNPAAGVGILTAAFCERIAALHSPRTITAHLFENDPRVVPYLRQNLDNCKRELIAAGHRFHYVVHSEDFIRAASHGLNGGGLFDEAGFNFPCDGVIMNPPYFKLRKDSLHAKWMLRIVHGQPNRSALKLLALAGLNSGDPWTKARKQSLRIWDMMAFMRENCGKDYAANSRETIRRQTIHQFEQARVVDRKCYTMRRSIGCFLSRPPQATVRSAPSGTQNLNGCAQEARPRGSTSRRSSTRPVSESVRPISPGKPKCGLRRTPIT